MGELGSEGLESLVRVAEQMLEVMKDAKERNLEALERTSSLADDGCGSCKFFTVEGATSTRGTWSQGSGWRPVEGILATEDLGRGLVRSTEAILPGR